MTRLTYFILALLLTTSTANAQPALTGGIEYAVTASIGSHHFEERSAGRDFNEFNPGLGLEVFQAPFTTLRGMPVRTFIAGGYYHNSIDKPSLYATGGVEACHEFGDKDWAFCPGIQAGAVTGYYHTVTPAAIGYAKLQYQDSYAKLGVIPPVNGSNDTSVPTTLLLQIGYRFQ